MTTRTILATVIVSLLGIVLLGTILDWMSTIDAKREQAYAVYEECVEREYGRTVASYYQEHGTTPECE